MLTMAKLWRLPLGLAAVGTMLAVSAFAQYYGPNYGQNGQNRIAQPGAVNYVEGNVSIDGRTITNQTVGTAQVEQGQTLETAQGKAEMLLTPGVFLRLADNSAVQLVSNSLVNTQVQLQRGRAMIEVDQIARENNLSVLVGGSATRLDKKGLYEFDADMHSVAVFDGQAQVRVGDRTIDVDKGKELMLAATGKLKPRSFDRKAPDELFAWSKLRSEYMAEANASSAQMIYVENPWWWYGTGWYWNPWFDSWAFVPGGGLFYSPFGFGFYSPVYLGFYGYHGFPGRGGYGYRGFAASPGPGFGGGGFGGGFHGGGFGGGGRR
jgi:hypothetical protein